MKRRLEFRASAKRDFTNLAARSERAWGKRQTRTYLDEVERKLQDIVENPMLGHDAELPYAGLRHISSGRDVIFYTFDDRQVEIVRIIYERMDFDAWLR